MELIFGFLTIEDGIGSLARNSDKELQLLFA